MHTYSLPNSVEPKGSAEGSPEKKGDESSPQTLPQSVIPTESELEVTSSHLGTVSAEIGLNDKDTDVWISSAFLLFPFFNLLNTLF